jgi:hypothetical protein
MLKQEMFRKEKFSGALRLKTPSHSGWQASYQKYQVCHGTASRNIHGIYVVYTDYIPRRARRRVPDDMRTLT